MSCGYFWLAVVLHLSWPYRWLLNRSTEKRDYTVVKEISSRQPDFHTEEILAGRDYWSSPQNAPVSGTDRALIERNVEDIDKSLIIKKKGWVAVVKR